MCLYVRADQWSMTAERDLVVYKVLLKTDYGYVTPVQRAEVKLGKTYKSELKKRIALYKGANAIGMVNEGLHSYTSYEAANKVAKDLSKYKLVIIVMCMVPKGAEYYENVREEEIASDELRYTKTVWDNN